MAALVTMDQAKQHLRIMTSDTDADIALKLEQASELVLKYVSTRIPEWDESDVLIPEPPAWTAATAPTPIKAATLLVLGHLFEHRGDNMESDTDLWGAIGRLLSMYRDPVVR